MKIARQSDGFSVTWPPTIDALIEAECAENPAFRQYWGDIIERLKFTAHREGTPEPRLGKGYQLLAINGLPWDGRPRVVIGYLVLGDRVRIRLLRISV